MEAGTARAISLRRMSRNVTGTAASAVSPLANPERPLESAGERVSRCVPLTQEQAGVGRCNG
jgi:hypothetical protein